MASRRIVRLPHLQLFFPQLLDSPVLRRTSVCTSCLRSFTSTPRRPNDSPPASKLLVRLRKDLKSAMQQKDQPRLAVLRALLADITNASKTSQPVATNAQFLSLLRKRIAASEAAAQEARGVSRQDLADKEEAQIGVMKEYAEEMQGDALGADAVRSGIEEVVAALGNGKVVMGEVLKKLLGPGGKFDGQTVDGKEVARMVKEVLDARKGL